VVVDADGRPVQWAEPTLIRLGPERGSAVLHKFLAAFVGDAT
jgi:hypothetical protein